MSDHLTQQLGFFNPAVLHVHLIVIAFVIILIAALIINIAE